MFPKAAERAIKKCTGPKSDQMGQCRYPGSFALQIPVPSLRSGIAPHLGLPTPRSGLTGLTPRALGRGVTGTSHAGKSKGIWVYQAQQPLGVWINPGCLTHAHPFFSFPSLLEKNSLSHCAYRGWINLRLNFRSGTVHTLKRGLLRGPFLLAHSLYFPGATRQR